MSQLKITQTKSGIGYKQNQKDTLRSLGLKRMHDTVMHALGPSAALAGADAPTRGRLADSWLYYRAASIFAGTSEVQRNIIAQRVLGLPRR